MSTLASNWNYPNSIRAGAGRIDELAAVCQELNIKAPLLVTDPGLAELPMIKVALKLCADAGLSIGLFSGIQGNPSGEQVSEGTKNFRQGKHDGVIAFGGGSALDAGKAIALMSGQQRPLWGFEDVGDNWTRVIESGVAPVVAIPTTAGTGSEVGRASVITDVANHIKKIIFHPKMLPSIVILDPELTTGLPAHITAATGLDALSHNLEALCAPGYHPMADGIAMEGIRLIHQFLPRAVEQGDDLEARMQMLTASSMGATAFQKGLGAMHALAHPLGALYNAHHGLLNAVLMPYVLKANRIAIEESMQRLGRYLGLDEAGFDGVMSWVLDLRRQLNIPHTLAGIGIDSDRAQEVGDMAVADPSSGGNPVEFSAEQYASIFKDAVNGTL
jgi:alcohol dehydrogenase class IV